jgi:hypothetical protein
MLHDRASAALCSSPSSWQLNKNATAYQRTYSAQVKTCNELQRILRYIEDELKKLSIDVPKAPETQSFVREIIEANRSTQVPPITRLNTLADELRGHEKDLRDLSENYQKLLKVYNTKVRARAGDC